ncbi:MAG: PAS domain-containing protein [Halieaceae bacterium]|uniref:PAS domain-containing protein n=1 Tax=Haliea alexandrii TaxID=2448162 RepID=UPI000F0B0484|nr:PAS domain-containing protein [Haliea alexandrii]MCR9184585.1 PAS domain-containing protein [Halieaceae bacterium]
MPVTRLGDDMRVVDMSPASLRMHGMTLEEVRGKTLSELAHRPPMTNVLPSAWRRTAPLTKDPIGGLLEDAARQYGNATAWVWLLTPSGRLFRGILNVIKLHVGFLTYLANVEDPFTRSLVRAEPDGTIIGSLGARWTLETMQVFEDFIAGDSLLDIASSHKLSKNRVRTILDDLSDQTGYETPGALRAAIYRNYADEMVPARQTIFPVVTNEVPGFPIYDRAPV